MRRFMMQYIWPVVCGVLLAIVIANIVPNLIINWRSGNSFQLHSPFNVKAPFSYADAVSRAAPAVVTVSSLKQVNSDQTPLMRDPFYRQWQPAPTTINHEKPLDLGSGVIVDTDGYILTNNHVITGADEIIITLADGRTTSANIIGTDPDTDLAVLKITLKNLPTITLANSDKIRTGDVALAIGNPFNVGQTVTMGIISAIGRARLGLSAYENFIQTDASINPGNSGGALINANGALIGINTAIFSPSGGSQGIGFAIPSNIALSVLKNIIIHGKVIRGWLGIEAQRDPLTLARSLKLNVPGSVMITNVIADGPAALAGLKSGDRILAINNVPLLDPNAAINEIANVEPGKQIKLTLSRDGKTVEAHITVGIRPQNLPTIYNPNQALTNQE